MSNPQPVQMVAALTKQRSHEVREALRKMKISVDANDIVDIDAIDLEKLKDEITKATPARRETPPHASKVGTKEDVLKELGLEEEN